MKKYKVLLGLSLIVAFSTLILIIHNTMNISKALRIEEYSAGKVTIRWDGNR